jgi:integrase
MTALRKRMIACRQLRGWSARTQDRYVRAVRPRAEPSRQSPDVLTAEERRPSFLDIQKITPSSRRASTLALGGITGVFEPPLHRDWTTLRVVRAPREQTLPGILSREEVRRRLGGGRRPRSRVCLSTIYACGLRLQDGTHLHVRALERARMRIHVRHGKGGNARDCPLARPHAGTAAPVWG